MPELKFKLKSRSDKSSALLIMLMISLTFLILARFNEPLLGKTLADILIYFSAIFSIFLLYFLSGELTKVKSIQDINSELESRLNATINSLESGLICTDGKGRITGMNASAEHLTLWKLNESIGKPVTEVYNVIHEETGKPFRSIVSRILEDGESVQTENHTVLFRKNTQKLVISNSGAPVTDKTGNVIGSVILFRDISQRKREQNELESLRRQLSFQNELSNELFCRISRVCKFENLNNSSIQLLGYEADELKGSSVMDIVSEKDRPRIIDRITDIANGLRSDPLLAEMIHKDGRLILMEWKFKWDESSKSFFACGKMFDEKKSADYLPENINRFVASAVRDSGVRVWYWDFETHKLYTGSETESYFDTRSHEFEKVYDDAFLNVHSDDRIQLREDIQNAIWNGNNLKSEFRLKGTRGNVSYYKLLATVEKNKAGKPIRMGGVSWDISSGNINRDIMPESELLNSSVLNSLSSRVAVIDRKGNILKVSASWKSPKNENGVLAVLAEEGRNFFEEYQNSSYADDPDAARILDGIRSVGDNKTARFSGEYGFLSGKENKWYSIEVSRFKDDRNLMIIEQTDITAAKLAELEKERVTRDLIIRNAHFEQFSYMVSHYLRAPLVNIMGSAELLDYKQTSTDELIKIAGHMSNSAHKLDEVIRDLNEILNIKVNSTSVNEKINISELVNEVVLAMQNLHAADDVVFQIEIKDDGNLNAVRIYLYSILYNLIHNSVKYRNPDKEAIVFIGSRRVGRSIEIVVKDNGLGMDINKWGDGIFGIYKRFHKHVEGKGLGLYMVKTQVESMGGNIDVKSEPGIGTEFTILLPDSGI